MKNNDKKSKDGTYQIHMHLDEKTTDRVIRYCNFKGISRTKFVTDCVIAQLNQLEREMYSSLSQEELIDMLLDLQSDKKLLNYSLTREQRDQFIDSVFIALLEIVPEKEITIPVLSKATNYSERVIRNWFNEKLSMKNNSEVEDGRQTL